MSEGEELEDDQANRLAAFALTHALESLQESGGPLIPFVVVESGSTRRLERIVADRLEMAVEKARARARQLGSGDVAAVAWDGYRTDQGRKLDAVFIQVGRRGDAASRIFLQRYELDQDLHLVGKIELVETAEPFFA